MLLRTIGHLLGLDAGWFMYDLLWVFVAMVFMMYAYHVINGNNRGIKGFIIMMLMLYAVLDIISISGWVLFPAQYMLHFTVFQVAVIVLCRNTKLERYTLPIFLCTALFMSWAVTPF